MTNILLRFSCDFCGKQFTESLYLKNHLRLHSDFSYICDYCGKRSKTKPNFMKHLFQIHLKIKFNCDECDQVYTDKQTLKHHKVRAHGMEAAFKCEKCPEKFCYPSQLKVHDMVHHLKMKVYTKRSTTSSQEYFECKQCKKVSNKLSQFWNIFLSRFRYFEANTTSKNIVICMKGNLRLNAISAIRNQCISTRLRLICWRIKKRKSSIANIVTLEWVFEPTCKKLKYLIQ